MCVQGYGDTVSRLDLAVPVAQAMSFAFGAFSKHLLVLLMGGLVFAVSIDTFGARRAIGADTELVLYTKNVSNCVRT